MSTCGVHAALASLPACGRPSDRSLTQNRHVPQLLAKQALWSLSRSNLRVAALAAALPGVMKALLPALNLNNRWNSFQCTLYAVRRNAVTNTSSLQPPDLGTIRVVVHPDLCLLETMSLQSHRSRLWRGSLWLTPAPCGCWRTCGWCLPRGCCSPRHADHRLRSDPHSRVWSPHGTLFAQQTHLLLLSAMVSMQAY